jgi:ferredoxin
VTVTGIICPPAPNVTVRIAFTRPDYSYVEQYVLTDNKTGAFSVTQKLDMVGYWNIFPIYGHMSDRLYAVVTDPANPLAPEPTPKVIPVPKPNYTLIIAAIISFSIGVVAFAYGTRNKTRKISALRLFIQISLIIILFVGVFYDHSNFPVPAAQLAPHEFLVGTNLLGVPMPDGLPAPWFGCYYPCGKTVTCVLWEIQTYIYPFWNAGRGWGVNYDATGITRLAVVFAVVIVASVLLGRVFCGWVCPFGLYVDVMTRLRKALRIKHRTLSDKTNEAVHQLKYVILALLILLSFVFGAQAITGTQLIPGTQKGGAVYEYGSAPFCQVCPMKPLCIFIDTGVGLMKPEWITAQTTGQFYQLGYYITSINVLVLILVTIAAFFLRRSWCRICPLGGLIALFNRFPPFKWISGVRLDKQEEKCTKCGVCKRVCPTQVKEVKENKGGDVTTSKCILCLRCVEMCPYEDCLKFKVLGKTVCKSRNWLNNSNDTVVE